MVTNAADPLLFELTSYYSEKLAQHGATPRGVDWNDEVTQSVRFAQLCKILTDCSNFSLNDLGCGYGALLDHLAARFQGVRYVGVDISRPMIAAAQERHLGNDQARFVTSSEPDTVADYAVASGIFNVRLHHSERVWAEHVEATLDVLNRTSRKGFAFNCLTSYSDEDKKRSDLYYADPCQLFDFCKRHFSRQVALFHDYGLFEFTILVRKT